MLEPSIELHAVTRRFGAVHALYPITLSIPRGMVVALSGPSGSGKTTLLNLLCGLDVPTGGRVRVLGEEPARLNEAGRAALRRRMGLIFQNFALLPAATVVENIEIGLRLAQRIPRSHWKTRIEACLDTLGMTNWAQHRAYELSGGQQQRVAIARALVSGPELIIADEPTGDLDPVTANRVMRLFNSLAACAGVTVVLATHDPAAIVAAGMHLQLRDGVLMEQPYRPQAIAA